MRITQSEGLSGRFRGVDGGDESLCIVCGCWLISDSRRRHRYGLVYFHCTRKIDRIVGSMVNSNH